MNNLALILGFVHINIISYFIYLDTDVIEKLMGQIMYCEVISQKPINLIELHLFLNRYQKYKNIMYVKVKLK